MFILAVATWSFIQPSVINTNTNGAGDSHYSKISSLSRSGWSRCPDLFEDEFLIPIGVSDPMKKVGKDNIVAITDFYLSPKQNRMEEVKKATKRNMQRNAQGVRFAYIISSPKCGTDSACQFLQNAASEVGADVDIYWAPGGATTYQHIFATAMFYPNSTFIQYHSDISLGNVSEFLPSCNLDETALFASRTELPEIMWEDPPYKQPKECQYYQGVGSSDVVITREDLLNCDFLFNMRYAPFYWGAEAVLGSQIQGRLGLEIINTCPHWEFYHLHQTGERNGRPRIQVNHGRNDFDGKTKKKLGDVCPKIGPRSSDSTEAGQDQPNHWKVD